MRFGVPAVNVVAIKPMMPNSGMNTRLNVKPIAVVIRTSFSNVSGKLHAL